MGKGERFCRSEKERNGGCSRFGGGWLAVALTTCGGVSGE